MRNIIRYSYINVALCIILLAWSGCKNDMDDSVETIRSGANKVLPLTIRGIASDFNDSSTRTTEESYTTKFRPGDAIGIFALRDFATPNVATIDDVYNLKLIYSEKGGKGIWTPEAGDTHVLYSYEDLTYVAYYPYQDGITILKDDMANINADLVNKLSPKLDQSTQENYALSDLMTASGTPTIDPNDPSKLVLTLEFTHQFSLLILKPRALVKCLAPEGKGFEYRDEAKAQGPDLLAKDATINGIKALRMDDGTFRAIMKITATEEIVPTGSYKTKDDKTILYTGNKLVAGKLAAGKYYIQQVDTPLFGEGTVTRELQIGDFFYRDGKILSTETPTIPDPTNCVGILLVPASGSDASYGGNCVGNTIHGHVISVYDVATCKWGPNGNIGTNTSDSWGDFRGYQLTQRMKQDADDNYGGLSTSNYAAAYHCLNYGNTDKGKLLTATNSGWYFPSEGFLYRLAMLSPGPILASLSKLVNAGYGAHFVSNAFYWDSSTANNDTQARVVKITPGQMGFVSARSNSRRVRAVLTF